VLQHVVIASHPSTGGVAPVAKCCGLQCVAMCAAVCGSVWHSVAVCCSVWQYVAVRVVVCLSLTPYLENVCCSVLQCVAVCGSVLQCACH